MPWLIFALVVSVVIAFVVYRLDLSLDSWRTVVMALCIAILLTWEERFTRWWDMQRLRRELARRPIAHRTDTDQR